MENKFKVAIEHTWEVECVRNGEIVWTEKFDNIVVTAGLNKYLDATLKTGLATPLWYVGLKDTGTPDPGDTMANHATWAEIDNYTGDRQAWTPGVISAGSVSNTGAKAVFPVSGDDTLYGAFLCDAATGSGAGVTLLGVGDFLAPRPTLTGDTLNVTVTCTQVAA